MKLSQQNDIAIKVENLSKAYKLYNKPVDRMKESLHPLRKKYHHDFYALNDVSFEVKKGETVGIIGKNGSGKSTLLKILTGVLTPTSGNVLVNGKISALLELGAGFNPEFTGVENVYFSGSIMGYTKGEMDAKIDEILSFADIGEFAYQPVKMYSSGMFARLAFAVSVNVDPEVLILDEILSVGDIRFQLKSFRKMNEFMESGKTIIFVSHSSDQIRQLCSRAIWLSDGRIFKTGDAKILSQQYHAFMAHGIIPDSDKNEKIEITNIEKEIHSSQKDEIDWDNISEDVNRSGEGGVRITKVALYTEKPYKKVYNLEGGEDVIFAYEFESLVDVEMPMISFIVYDDKSQPLFGSNSYVLDKKYNTINKGAIAKAFFYFKFPCLKNGKYVFSIGIADGTQQEHIRLEVIFDAYIIDLSSDELRRKQGLMFNIDTDMDIK